MMARYSHIRDNAKVAAIAALEGLQAPQEAPKTTEAGSEYGKTGFIDRERLTRQNVASPQK
jgi:hypothetical protein